jgi:hypothetical protein
MLKHGDNFASLKETVPGKGCAIAQAISRRLLTSAAQVLAHVRLCGICGGESGTRAVYPHCYSTGVVISDLTWDGDKCNSSQRIVGHVTKHQSKLFPRH